MKVGRIKNSWTRNCLAAGLSQGFIEPLEATALHIVIYSALEFAKTYETGVFTDRHREVFKRADHCALRRNTRLHRGALPHEWSHGYGLARKCHQRDPAGKPQGDDDRLVHTQEHNGDEPHR